MQKLHLIIISGLSGSGKSNVIKCIEDIGFFCIDNLPLPLLPKFIELCSGIEIKKVALGIDIRERDFLDEYLNLLDDLKRGRHHVEIFFLEADEDVLVRRFSETRRPHPLANDKPVEEGIRLERERLAALKDRADKIFNTSDYNVHQLKEVISNYCLLKDETEEFNIYLLSFGYKYGIPYDADLIFDVRFLQNPNFHPELKKLSGEDPRVINYILKKPEGEIFLKKVFDLLNFLIPLYKQEGKFYLTIGIGCTGGRHRSVAIVNKLKEYLGKTGYVPGIRHRDITK
ncbi:MAG: RNase adapter RapZ [Nitrospirota bacterium]